MNYPDLPRSGLPGPRLLRSGSSERPKVSRDHERRYAPFERLPGSIPERAGTGPKAAPDSPGGFPLEVVRSVPLLPVGHSATTDGARFSSSFERGSSLQRQRVPGSEATASPRSPTSGRQSGETASNGTAEPSRGPRADGAEGAVKHSACSFREPEARVICSRAALPPVRKARGTFGPSWSARATATRPPASSPGTASEAFSERPARRIPGSGRRIVRYRGTI